MIDQNLVSMHVSTEEGRLCILLLVQHCWLINSLLGECIVVIYMNKKTRGWVCTVFSTWYIAVGMWWGVCWWTSACRRWGNWLHGKKQTEMLTQTRFKNSLLCDVMWNSVYSRQGTPNPSTNCRRGGRRREGNVTFGRFVQISQMPCK